MSLIKLFYIAVFILNACLGLGVFLANRKRTLNQHYLSASIMIGLWLSTNWIILNTTHSETAELFMRIASAIAVTLPAISHLLRLSILFPEDSWLRIIEHAKFLWLACLGIDLLCFTPAFIKSVRMPGPDAQPSVVPEPVIGWGYLVFTLFFVGLIISLLVLFIRDRKKVSGLQRIELDFITAGYGSALATATLCGLLVTLFTSSSQTVPLANASSILAFTTIISYGIATRRILDMATFIQRMIAHLLLTIYLVMVYLFVWNLSDFVFCYFLKESCWISQLLAALTVAFSMAPVHGRLQKVVEKLVSSTTINAAVIMQQAGSLFQSVSTLDDLLNGFSKLLTRTLDTPHVDILFKEASGFHAAHLGNRSPTEILLTPDDALVTLLENDQKLISIDMLIRHNKGEKQQAAAKRLCALGASIALGIYSKSQLIGLIFLGERLNGKIYTHHEQTALQLLCTQFAVALENARMYTEMQDSKIRNEMMLDQMTSGVIVADPDRKISLFNHEAQRITDLAPEDAIGMDIMGLPLPVFQILDATLGNQFGVRNADATLIPTIGTESSTSIRMSSEFLFGHDGNPMGALLVLTNTTELKSLEEQVRRTDQLSRVGTLAAGMAHEIKNPLVTIKTFTQLLPQRYEDPDFRSEFAALVAQEVTRIDGIVNELLSFSKPAKPHLMPMHLHRTLEQTLKLTHEQMVQRNILLLKNLRAEVDCIMGDAKLLSQALVNLQLNAIEAIGQSGAITVATSNCQYRFAEGDTPGKSTAKPCIRLNITDTGNGIEHSAIKKIFDPFFTNKSQGTGMGLSIANGIVNEHSGAIEVDSIPGQGTSFHIYIPVLEDDA